MKSKEFSLGISVGGAVLFRNDLSFKTERIDSLAEALKEKFSRNLERMVVVAGGGPFARFNIEGFKRIGIDDQGTLDFAGIVATRYNAKKLAERIGKHDLNVQYVRNYRKNINLLGDIIVTGGTKRGQTTDAVLVNWATLLGFRQLINITNVDYIYELNPDGTLNFSRPIKDMRWANYIDSIGQKHESGEHWPFGVVASNIARKHRLTVSVVGPDIENLRNLLNGKSFKGTILHP